MWHLESVQVVGCKDVTIAVSGEGLSAKHGDVTRCGIQKLPSLQPHICIHASFIMCCCIELHRHGFMQRMHNHMANMLIYGHFENIAAQLL